MTEKRSVKPAFVAAAVLTFLAGVLLYFRSPRLAAFLMLGACLGAALEWSGFCLVSAVTDLFASGASPALMGAAAGLCLAVPVYALFFHAGVQDPRAGILPLNAHVVPLGWNVPLGGFLFGFGMMPAGHCVLGGLRRIGEGSLRATAAVIGTIFGLFLYKLSEKTLQSLFMKNAEPFWIPAKLGYAGAVILICTVLCIVCLLLLLMEKKTGRHERSAASVRLFWGGVSLSFIAVSCYAFLDHPLGVTGELGRWAEILLEALGIRPEEAAAVQGACVIKASAGDLTWGLMLNAGIILGALLVSLFEGRFRFSGFLNSRWTFLCLGGAVIMGFGTGLAGGCGLGALYSSVACLGLDGWVFGLAALPGAFFGFKFLEKAA